MRDQGRVLRGDRGDSIDSRMKSRLAVAALRRAVQMRGDVAAFVVQSDRGSQFRNRKVVRELRRHRMVRSMGAVATCGDNTAILLYDEAYFVPSARRVDTPGLSETCCIGRISAEISSDLRIRTDRPAHRYSSGCGIHPGADDQLRCAAILNPLHERGQTSCH